MNARQQNEQPEKSRKISLLKMDVKEGCKAFFCENDVRQEKQH